MLPLGGLYKMNEKIVELEEYKNLIENKNGLDNGTKNIDELSLEELEGVNELYIKEVSLLAQEVQSLEEENKRLRRILGK